MNTAKKALSQDQQEALITLLQSRFENNMDRHKKLKWTAIADRLRSHPDRLWSVNLMEQTGGEPDVVEYDKRTGECIFYDCAAESPSGRRSLCYDPEALASRKKHKPKDSALQMAADMGITLLTEEQYRQLQQLGKFDTKTSSWIQTPPAIRKLGGALFADNRYDHVFVYHNGAESYYAARGFRGWLKI